MTAQQVASGSEASRTGAWHGRYGRTAWAIAPIWSALAMLLPYVRTNLHSGLGFYGASGFRVG